MERTNFKININKITLFKILRYFIVIIMFVFLIATLPINIAKASDSPWEGSYTTGEGTSNPQEITWSLLEYREKILKIYDVFSAVSLALGTVGIVAGAYRILVGSEDEGKRGRKQIKLILIAVVAIHVAPAIISLGYELVAGAQWDPYNPMG